MPEDQQPEFQRVDVRDYLQVLWRGKFIILITTILVVSGAFFYSYLQPNKYKAFGQMLISPRPAGELIGGGSGGNGNNNGSGVEVEIIILGSNDFRKKVQEQLGRAPNVEFAGSGETALISLSATGENPDNVAEDVNVYMRVYQEERASEATAELNASKTKLESDITNYSNLLNTALPNSEAQRTFGSQLSAAQSQLVNVNAALAAPQQSGVRIITGAVAPTSPDSPKPLKNALAALGIGLVLGIALAFLREYLDDTIKTKEDVERASGLTVVGMIPQLSDWKDRASSRLAAKESPTGPTAEAYRTLRTSIQFLGLERTIRTLLVTSPAAGEGKSTTAANLAITFAHAGQRVVLLSSDFRRPRVHSFFGLSNQVGFTSVLLGETPFSEALQTVPDEPYVTVLPSGPRPPNPSELLNSRRAAEAIAALAGRFDLVLIDSPPVLPVSDSLVIAGLADAILVVARAGQTRKKGLHRSIELLRQVEAPLVGAVLNGADGGNDYGYGSEYHPETFAPRTAPMPSGNGQPNGKRRLFRGSKAQNR